jgi:hypothetical protein
VVLLPIDDQVSGAHHILEPDPGAQVSVQVVQSSWNIEAREKPTPGQFSPRPNSTHHLEISRLLMSMFLWHMTLHTYHMSSSQNDL